MFMTEITGLEGVKGGLDDDWLTDGGDLLARPQLRHHHGHVVGRRRVVRRGRTVSLAGAGSGYTEYECAGTGPPPARPRPGLAAARSTVGQHQQPVGPVEEEDRAEDGQRAAGRQQKGEVVAAVKMVRIGLYGISFDLIMSGPQSGLLRSSPPPASTAILLQFQKGTCCRSGAAAACPAIPDAALLQLLSPLRCPAQD